MDINRFIGNVIEQIKEAQLKLGFVKEVIRLYFPFESLKNLLQVECESGKELIAMLEKKEWNDTVLGELRFSLRNDRIEVCIPSEGAVYVHESVPDPPFLSKIIELFQKNHNLTIEEICECFSRFNKQYICQKVEEEAGFDYVLYFPSQNPDPWYYCIRTEMGHTIYHRFTREDYHLLISQG